MFFTRKILKWNLGYVDYQLMIRTFPFVFPSDWPITKINRYVESFMSFPYVLFPYNKLTKEFLRFVRILSFFRLFLSISNSIISMINHLSVLSFYVLQKFFIRI